MSSEHYYIGLFVSECGIILVFLLATNNCHNANEMNIEWMHMNKEKKNTQFH